MQKDTLYIASLFSLVYINPPNSKMTVLLEYNQAIMVDALLDIILSQYFSASEFPLPCKHVLYTGYCCDR